MTVTIRLLVKLVIVQTVPALVSHPTQVAEVAEPLGVAVSVIPVPLGKLLLHVVAQPRPGGLLATVPVPTISTVRVGLPLPPDDDPGQSTFAVMKPVTIAPEEDLPPAL